jgi:hypothetical protein
VSERALGSACSRHGAEAPGRDEEAEEFVPSWPRREILLPVSRRFRTRLGVRRRVASCADADRLVRRRVGTRRRHQPFDPWPPGYDSIPLHPKDSRPLHAFYYKADTARCEPKVDMDGVPTRDRHEGNVVAHRRRHHVHADCRPAVTAVREPRRAQVRLDPGGRRPFGCVTGRRVCGSPGQPSANPDTAAAGSSNEATGVERRSGARYTSPDGQRVTASHCRPRYEPSGIR